MEVAKYTVCLNTTLTALENIVIYAKYMLYIDQLKTVKLTYYSMTTVPSFFANFCVSLCIFLQYLQNSLTNMGNMCVDVFLFHLQKSDTYARMLNPTKLRVSSV